MARTAVSSPALEQACEHLRRLQPRPAPESLSFSQALFHNPLLQIDAISRESAWRGICAAPYSPQSPPDEPSALPPISWQTHSFAGQPAFLAGHLTPFRTASNPLRS